MAARASESEDAERLQSLMLEVATLVQEDADAYAEVLASSGPRRKVALGRAADAPVAVAQTAAEVAGAAADLAERGNPKLRGEAVAAALLASAAARAASELVGMNLASEPADSRIGRASAAAEAAARAAERVSTRKHRPPLWKRPRGFGG
jgi:formiminotetrahydrofolate cyclodeaminase